LVDFGVFLYGAISDVVLVSAIRLRAAEEQTQQTKRRRQYRLRFTPEKTYGDAASTGFPQCRKPFAIVRMSW
jgi:hypothetical protein